MTDIAQIIRPKCKGEASVMIAAHKLHTAADEIEALRHDIERHLQIAAELATENGRLRTIETATRSLFTGSRKFMEDGDQEQWDAYDLLKAKFSVCQANEKDSQ